MQTVGPYLQESKDEIVSRFRQSGLSQTRFCKLSDVPISNSTLSEWLRKAGYDKCGNPCEKKQEQDRFMLNIVCYNVGENADHQVKRSTPSNPPSSRWWHSNRRCTTFAFACTVWAAARRASLL